VVKLSETQSKFEEALVDKSSLIIEKYLPWFAYLILVICLVVWFGFTFVPEDWNIYIKVVEIEKKITTSFLTKDKTNMLITVGVFLVGFYVTVMSVLGSSYSAAVVKISEEGLSRKFVRVAVASFFIGFIFLIITVLYDIMSKSTFFTIFYLSLILSTLTEALRFSTIVMHIYYSNIKHAADEVEKKNETEQQLMEILLRMESKLYDPNSPSVDSEDYLEELRRKLKENETAESSKKE
jgi:hypothetical protein